VLWSGSRSHRLEDAGGVDLEDCPEWVAECEATLDSLDQIGPGQRIYWLSVPLGVEKPSDRVVEPLKAATSDLRDRLGLPRASLPTGEVERRLGQAARIADSIPGPFNPTPATPAQMVWLHQHSIRRGLFQDLDLPDGAQGDLAAVLLTPKSSASLGEPVLDEGGQSDLDPKSPARLNPINRRYLKVTDASTIGEAAASYQTLMVGLVSAAQAIVFWSPGRCRNEATYATLAGASPLPASSGTRWRSRPRTRAYIALRRSEGRTDRRSAAASRDTSHASCGVSARWTFRGRGGTDG
jgi:hypothetical protein